MRFSFCCVFALFAVACPSKKPDLVDAGPVEAPAGDGISAVLKHDGPPHPQAQRVCKALVGSVAERRGACCSGSAGNPGAPSVSPIEPACVTALSALLVGKEAVVDEAALAACEQAQAQALTGCDWVRPLAPLPPAACSNLVTGSLASGGRCRSSLECKPGLRCRGASPLDVGRCAEPLPDGAQCGTAIDGAAIAIPEPDIDRAHPECASGACHLGRCQPRIALGFPCSASAQCTSRRCDMGFCKVRIPVGRPCSTRGGCADGLHCREGTCQALSSTGGACSNDFDCSSGGCVQGKCAQKCSITR